MRIAFLTLLTSVAAAPAFAADLGTYRPGTPYHSVIVPTADVCESQCAGDARCRGWNYVKAAPQASGVCEFQSQVSQPISSAISISGVNASAGYVSNRIVAGNTNTVRVGTSVPPQQTSPTVTTSQTGRRIVRAPIPSQTQRGQVQPRFQPALDGYTPSRAQQRPTTQPALSRGPARNAPQARFQRPVAPQAAPRQAAPSINQPQYARPQIQGRPPIGQTIAPPQSQVQSQTQYETQYQTQATRPGLQPQTQPSAQPMPRASVNNPVSWQNQPQQNLYGSLYDDVRVPASNSPMPLDPNAPIPTATARPTMPIGQVPLAGARPR